MTKIRKKFARVNRKINKMKNRKILDCLLIIIFFVSIVMLSATMVFISLAWNSSIMKLILEYLLDKNLIIQTIVVCFSFLFFSLLGAYRFFLIYNDIEKLPEVVTPKAKKFISEYPKANLILTPLIQEAENKDDGEKLLEILYEFYELRNLENKPKYLIKKTNDKIKKVKEEETLLKKKLGLS